MRSFRLARRKRPEKEASEGERAAEREAAGEAGAGPTAPNEKEIRAAAERDAIAKLAGGEGRARDERVAAETELRVDAAAERVREAEERSPDVGSEGEEPEPEPALGAGERSPGAEPQTQRAGAEVADPAGRIAAAEPDRALELELEAAERRLVERRQRTVEALERAAKRLEEVETIAAQAEKRAARAERLAAIKSEEAESNRKLREILDQIESAERRANEAEQRARAAVEEETSPLPEADPDRIASAEPSEPAAPAAGSTPATDQVNLNAAGYDELRELGLSVIQTGRVLAYRERTGGFGSVDELARIPGFPAGFLDQLKGRVRL